MFRLLHQSKISRARLGIIKTAHGDLATPLFMPDATRGFVRQVTNSELIVTGVNSLVVNTLHLYLDPGLKIIKKFGGLHKFMNWGQPLLSDSGGYQVFSLIHKNNKLGKILADKVIFRSPLDGASHALTPEKSIQIQFNLGADMLVCLDDCPPNDYSREKISAAVERTIRWARRCRAEYDRQIKKRKLSAGKRPLLFAVIQGGPFTDLRETCAAELIKLGFDGYGFGARHIDEEGYFLSDVLKITVEAIPTSALRFALGMGKPEDIVRAVKMGWDIFDCVIPTREARHGRLYYRIYPEFARASEESRGRFYRTINITNSKYKSVFRSFNKKCPCELCQNYSAGYLHYLFKTGDSLAQRLATLHNLQFYLDMMVNMRDNILHNKI